jgi:hypothetical protein
VNAVVFDIALTAYIVAAARELLTTPSAAGESAGADFETDDDPQAPWRRFT